MSTVQMNEVYRKAEQAKRISRTFFPDSTQKNNVLRHMAAALVEQKAFIMAENARDLENGRQNGMSSALLDRLALTTERIQGMADALLQIIEFPDPVGQVLAEIERPNGLYIEKRTVPLGVIGIIYEARPNVTVDAAGLCLKSGNAVILRGGSTAIHSNKAIVSVLHEAMQAAQYPVEFLQFIEDTDRSTVQHLLTCKQYVDVVIPRGGRSLIQFVVQNAEVPIIETGEGVCHVYVHEDANLNIVQPLVLNAKCQRPSVCNAAETLLVDQKVAAHILPDLVEQLRENGVESRGCERTRAIVGNISQATEEDWLTEYNDYILAIKVVSSLSEATEHINEYGTHHSECIVTENKEAAEQFMTEVDAAAVYQNASTRFTDGEMFGFGAEIGISTQKLHARGPMGLAELTSIKYYVYGTGQVRE